MATKYFQNYAAKRYAKAQAAGQAQAYQQKQMDKEEEAQMWQNVENVQTAHSLYLKGAEKLADKKLGKTAEGMELYKASKTPDQYGKGKFISDNLLPTKTEMNLETAGKLVGG